MSSSPTVTSPRETRPAGGRSAIVLLACFLALLVTGGARLAVGLTFRPIVDEFGWTRGTLGSAVALYMVVSAVATFLAGRMADRLSPRALLIGGTIVGGIGIALMSLVSQPWHALTLYGVIFAVGNGAASLVIVGVIVMRAYPGRAGIANAVAVSGMSVGQLLMISMLAAVLVQIGWRAVFVWIGAAHLVLLPLLFTLPGQGGAAHATAAAAQGVAVRAAARTRRFWLLIAIYAICGMDDFFVTTHVAAFAQDRGLGALLAGNLLAFMGLTGLAGVIAAGLASDRLGPAWPTAASFAARIVVFGWIAVDQSPLSVAIFALVFGATFLVTAPLTVVFVRESFGTRHLGAIAGLITMVHQIFGGVGAYLGAAIFDATGGYEAAFITMLASAILALALTLMLRERRA
ncbi:MAG: MFS transporter [Alphaproteobacteria bacterium]|nr:MFS transporter [Alphaproteobacteria bacterium]